MPATLDRLRAAGDERPALVAFLGVFGATLLCFLAIGAVLPVLPRYVKGPIGAGDVAVGIVVGAFAFSAIVSRPLGGRLADVRSRKAVHRWGMAICILGGLLLFAPAGVPGLIVARLVVGFGDGWVFTAGVTWAVDLAPPARRGQAIGMFGLAIWGGITIGAVIGEALLSLGSYEAVWAFAALSPALGLLVAQWIPAGVPVPQDAEVEVGAAEAGAPAVALPTQAAAAAPGGLRRFVPAAAVRPGIALALANVGYGTMAGFVVLLLDERGLGGGAAVFTLFAAAVVGTRLVVGTLPDRFGARRTALGAGLVQAVGLAIVGVAGSLAIAVLGAVVMGMGMSLVFPSLALMVVQRVGEERRGAAMGAFTSFFDLGVGLGAPFAGLVATLAGNYQAAFLAGAACCLAGALLGFATNRPRPAAGPAAA